MIFLEAKGALAKGLSWGKSKILVKKTELLTFVVYFEKVKMCALCVCQLCSILPRFLGFNGSSTQAPETVG